MVSNLSLPGLFFPEDLLLITRDQFYLFLFSMYLCHYLKDVEAKYKPNSVVLACF